MAYIGRDPNDGIIKTSVIHRYTATAGQTAFSGSYNINKSAVYLNGILLLPTTDYSISASAVTLASGASVGDILQVQQYAI